MRMQSAIDGGFNPYFFGFSLITSKTKRSPAAVSSFNPYFFGFSLITNRAKLPNFIFDGFNPYFFGFSLITAENSGSCSLQFTVSTLIFLDLA